jgi:hypothetical protein
MPFGNGSFAAETRMPLPIRADLVDSSGLRIADHAAMERIEHRDAVRPR